MRSALRRPSKAPRSGFGAKGGGEQAGGLLSEFGSKAMEAVPELLAFAAAATSIEEVFGEVAENDRATAALARFGVSAQEAADASDRLDKLELFFNGDRQQAAEAYGKLINGNTRGLEQLGIQLDANSTKEQRLAAIDALGARGAAAQAAENSTLTGSLKLLGRGLVDAAANGVQWLATNTGITAGLGWLNEKMGFAAKKADDLATAQQGAEGATKALNAELKHLPETAEQAARAIAGIQAAAENATNEIRIMVGMLKTAKGLGSDDETAALEDRLAVLNGEPEHVVKKRRADTNYAIAEADRQKDANNAETTMAAAKATLAKLDEQEKKLNDQPSRARFAELAQKEPTIGDLEAKKRADALQAEEAQSKAEYGGILIPREAARLRLKKDKLLGSGVRTDAEQQEFDDLAARRQQEDEAINSQRREALAAQHQAEQVKAALPLRRQKSDLEKKIADREFDVAEADKKDKEERKQNEAERATAQLKEEMYASDKDQKAKDAEETQRAAEARHKALHETIGAEMAPVPPKVDAQGRRVIVAPRTPTAPSGLDELKAMQKHDSPEAAAKKVEASQDKAIAVLLRISGKLEGLTGKLSQVEQRLNTVEGQQGK